MSISKNNSAISVSTHTIKTTTHGRYLVRRPSTSTPTPILVGFHGYGEHAARLLSELNLVPGTDKWLLLSIQGLHRFYSKSGRHVVSSWMTRQNRDSAIADNLSYVNDVVSRVKENHNTTNTVVYCGFSQGVAMAYRAAANGAHRCHGIVALAGDIPPELKGQGKIGWPRILIGRGNTDEWYTQDKMDTDLEFFHSIKVKPETCCFNAGHEWADDFRTSVGQFLRRIC